MYRHARFWSVGCNQRWLEDAPVPAREIRFDVASVMDNVVEVLEGAF